MSDTDKQLWIIRYSDGSMESVYGTLEDAVRRAEENPKNDGNFDIN